MKPADINTLTEAAWLVIDSWQGQATEQRATLLNAIRGDGETFEFVRDIFETVAMPREAFAKALGLNDLARHTPDSLPPRLKLALQVGGIVSLSVPWGALPIIKSRFKAHLREILTVLNAKNIESLFQASSEMQLDFELWGGDPVGAQTAAKATSRYIEIVNAAAHKNALLSVNVAKIMPPLGAWQSDSAASMIAGNLREIADACLSRDIGLMLYARNYAEVLMLPSILRVLADDSDYDDLSIGVVLYTEIPETLQQLDEVFEIAQARLNRGGKELTVRVTTRTLSSRERITGLVRGLAVPVTHNRKDRDAQNVRVLQKLTANKNVHTVFESEDVFSLALASVLSTQSKNRKNFALQMRQGFLPELAHAIAGHTPLRISTPLVPTNDFAGAIEESLEVLADAVNPDGPLDLSSEMNTRAQVRQRAKEALEASANEPPRSHRLQDRVREWDAAEQDMTRLYRPPTVAHQFDTGGLTAAVLSLAKQETGEIRLQEKAAAQTIPAVSSSGFANEADTDATSKANREWMRQRMTRSLDAAASLEKVDPEKANPEKVVGKWRELEHNQRAAIMRKVALGLASSRDLLVTAIATDRALTAPEIDHEIGRAIDATRYLAARAEGLRTLRGANFVAEEALVLAADRETPFGDFAEAFAAAIATGAHVVLVVAANMQNSIDVLLHEWFEAGLPTDTVSLDVTSDIASVLDKKLINSEIKRVILFAEAETQEKVRRLRPDITCHLQPLGLATSIVTASADLQKTVTEIADSAFYYGASHPRAPKAIILTAKSAKFLKRLADAVQSLEPAGQREDTARDVLRPQIAPLTSRPTKQEIRALTELEPGEKWLLVPRQLDDAGLVWSPGIRTGVKVDSEFWVNARRMPVIGVLQAGGLSDAIVAQNSIGSGSSASLFTNDETEMLQWLEETFAASLTVNKTATRARIERLPTGMWRKQSQTGEGLAGGPNRLINLGHWQMREGTSSVTLHLRGLDAAVRALIETAQSALEYHEFDLVRRAALADALAMRTQFGQVRDSVQLQTELNFLRYEPVAVHVRAAIDAPFASLVRVLVAGMLAGSPITISSARALPKKFKAVLDMQDIVNTVEDDESWLERVSLQGPAVSGIGEVPAERVRLIGGDAVRVSEWISAHPGLSVWGEAVTIAGSVELLGFMREQAVSIAATRHGFATELEVVREWMKDSARFRFLS